MAEAIGVVSGILGFASASIKITVSIIELINGFKDAPETITDLHDNLCILRQVLERLVANEQLVADDKRKGASEKDQDDPAAEVTKTVVKQCNKILRRISDVLKPMEEDLKKGKLQAAWRKFYTAAMADTIKDHYEQLERSKSNLILALTFDVRFTIVSSRSQIEPQSPSTISNSSTRDAGSAPPEYSKDDPHPGKPKRRDSELARTALRGSKAILSRFRPSGSHNKEETSVHAPPPSLTDLVASTVDNMKITMAKGDGKGPGADDRDLAMLQMLWRSDYERVQVLWNLNPEAVKCLKGMVNESMCDIFISSLQASPSTMKEINDPAASTLLWVDRNEEYIQWQEPKTSKLLLLEGKAGSGKSVFTKSILTKVQNLTADSTTADDAIVLSYFCNNRVRPNEACTSILKAYICQYLRENKDEFATLVEGCGVLKHDWNAAKASQFDLELANLLEIFSTILKISSKKTIYCVIDAIDECHRDEDMEMFIANLPHLVQNQPGTVVKFFISTRPDWTRDLAVDFSLLSLCPLKIILRPELTGNDIAQVVELELSRLESRLSIEPSDKAQLKDSLVAKAEGMMLWVVLAFREIGKKIKRKVAPNLQWVRNMVDKLPLEILGMYDHIMANIKKKYGDNAEEDEYRNEEKDEESDLNILWRLTLWAARAGRPMTVKELQYALAIDMSDRSFQDLSPKIVANLESVIACIPFLEIADDLHTSESYSTEEGDGSRSDFRPERAMTSGSTVRFIHQTAKEYILQIADSPSEKQKLLFKGASGSLWPPLDDAAMGRICVKFLSFRDFGCGPIRGFSQGVRFCDGFKAYIEKYGFLEYATSFWYYHIRQVGMGLDEDTKRLISFFCCDLKENLRLWCQVANFICFNEYTDFVDDYFGLHVVAHQGIDSMVQYFIDRGDDLDKRDEQGRTPYVLAYYGGCDSTVRMLEDAGADTNIEFSGYWFCNLPDLHDFVTSCSAEELQEEIASFDNINELDSFGRSVLFYACATGNPDIVSIILNAGVDLTIRDKHGRLAIDVALDQSCRQMVIAKMKEEGLELTPPMLREISCTHAAGLISDLTCDACGRHIWVFYYHCCDCSLDTDTYEICEDCWEKGKRCAVATHEPRPQVQAGYITSWIDYTPHLANMKIESPIKELERMRKHEELEIEKDEPDHEKGKGKIGADSTSGVDIGSHTTRGLTTRVPSSPGEIRKEGGCGCTIL
ncbi:hypothetical protein TWF696_005388 [Orbilia brochopaga]|uniref:NACHT domain-containing protein n=1 Tax=Orbilia brochopaga TaxID=3140254 RepID=A0AAV9V2B8_9PEZI